ncbi:DNA helicase IV [Saccharopolyspora antimicrobica]|uniref:DNA helicase IV n=1 Tax=Saccharopolyspora antimicrobica TaxID=455193 RepID=A0A1I4T6Z9_9PSEU|nr:ATP-binding domain-containing protein [Saccharopolyspora antimicrobica]RKT85836.1 DNA helicase IV [Saccharopolyspora antimicrobica]SFM72476.1 DNA helicase IV [Saccharopolyspora antimicrobica]
MSEASIKQAEIAVEQQHVDRVYSRLDELRSEAEAMRDKSYEYGREATPEALNERDVMLHHANRTLQALNAESDGLVFGRLDFAGGDAVHIGRLGIRDPQFENLLVDWRAPLAAAFYQATPEQPLDVIRRRVIRSSREQVVDLSDDLLDPERAPSDMRVIGDGALMAALTRSRGDSMRNIVATIQKEQDDAIRAPEGGVTEITGGPGTGKTAVALHRAAYLLYRDQRRLGGPGVLVVGPSPVFMSYISRVLPSMGEHNVELRALGEVLDGISTAKIDDPRTAEIKGSSRMVKVLRRALRLPPPEAPELLQMFYRGTVLKLQADDLKRIRRTLHNKGGQPNRNRMRAADALLEALWQKAKQAADEEFQPDRERLIAEIGDRIEFHRFLVAWWPAVYPMQVLRWLSDPARLSQAARRLLSAEEVDLLAKSWSEVTEWTVADIALIDELRVLAGAPPKRRRAEGEQEQPKRAVNYDEYAHVVIDESQDLSPMQWRMVGRRGRHASWTIVGDPVQSSWPDAEEAAAARREALSAQRTHRRFTLRTNYRNSAEIFALAADAVRDLVPADDLPVAVRTTGVEPAVREMPAEQLPAAVRTAAEELVAAAEGTIGLITTMARRDEVREWLSTSDFDADRVRVVGSLEAKGMEYDAVVVIDPDGLAAESSTGRRALYVALSRATQLLTVLKPS